MRINWKVRFKNPVFVAQLLAAAFLPIITYFGFKWEDMTSWGTIMDVFVRAAKNPVVVMAVIVSTVNAVNDPTTKGLSDSETARTYIKPR